MRTFPVLVAAVGLGALALPAAFTQSAPTEAPPAFDAQMQLVSNGFESQAQFDADRQTFEEVEGTTDGLGPVYNASSCVECHRNPVSGGGSQVNELRAGHFSRLTGFVEHPGGSLINDRATDPQFQERVLNGNEVRALRASLNILGDGFVEAIDDATFQQIVASQPLGMRGQIINVPIVEASTPSIGRFGWKDQNATLKSFAADAYLNEMGITTPFFPADNTSSGQVVDDGVADPEDDGGDVDVFARFMRSTGVPPRDAALAATPEALAGERLFTKIGCANCHVATIATATAGTVLHGGSFTVPAALGDKLIHPYSDFLLHNVGTGDGIVQNGGPATRLKLRTPPLWGLRSRARLMHDGGSLLRSDAILRHRGEATRTTFAYGRLPLLQKNQLIAFLNSL